MKIDDLRSLRDMHFDKEEYRAALDNCDDLLKQFSDAVSFDDHFKNGLCHFKLNEDALAVSCFEKALKMEPENLLAITNIGICLFNQGKLEEAFLAFNRAMKINPNVFPPWYYIGLHYLKIFQDSGDLPAMEKFVNCFRVVLTQAPDFGSLPIFDPNKDVQYGLDTFILLHSDVPDMSVDEVTAL